MKHYFDVKGHEMTVEIGCHHPAIENNTCPTGYGDCASCIYCKVEMTAVDFFKLNPKVPGVVVK